LSIFPQQEHSNFPAVSAYVKGSPQIMQFSVFVPSTPSPSPENSPPKDFPEIGVTSPASCPRPPPGSSVDGQQSGPLLSSSFFISVIESLFGPQEHWSAVETPADPPSLYEVAVFDFIVAQQKCRNNQSCAKGDQSRVLAFVSLFTKG
jgi:hypothetical protein